MVNQAQILNEQLETEQPSTGEAVGGSQIPQDIQRSTQLWSSLTSEASTKKAEDTTTISSSAHTDETTDEESEPSLDVCDEHTTQTRTRPSTPTGKSARPYIRTPEAPSSPLSSLESTPTEPESSHDETVNEAATILLEIARSGGSEASKPVTKKRKTISSAPTTNMPSELPERSNPLEFHSQPYFWTPMNQSSANVRPANQRTRIVRYVNGPEGRMRMTFRKKIVVKDTVVKETKKRKRESSSLEASDSNEKDLPTSSEDGSEWNKTSSSDNKPNTNTVDCICGAKREDLNNKRPMICCDECGIWKHNVCMGLSKYEEALPDEWFCEECKPEENIGTVLAMGRGEKIWEQRQQVQDLQDRIDSGNIGLGRRD